MKETILISKLAHSIIIITEKPLFQQQCQAKKTNFSMQNFVELLSLVTLFFATI